MQAKDPTAKTMVARTRRRRSSITKTGKPGTNYRCCVKDAQTNTTSCTSTTVTNFSRNPATVRPGAIGAATTFEQAPPIQGVPLDVLNTDAQIQSALRTTNPPWRCADIERLLRQPDARTQQETTSARNSAPTGHVCGEPSRDRVVNSHVRYLTTTSTAGDGMSRRYAWKTRTIALTRHFGLPHACSADLFPGLWRGCTGPGGAFQKRLAMLRPAVVRHIRWRSGAAGHAAELRFPPRPRMVGGIQ